METLRKIAKWLITLTVGLIVIMTLCWWLIPDESLNPEVEKLTAPQSFPPVADNAYFLFWGIKASPDRDAHAIGQTITAEHERLVAANAHLTGFTGFEVDHYLGKNPLLLKPATKRCNPDEHACLAFYQGMRQQIEADREKYAFYIERYRSLRKYPRFSERVFSLTITSPLPPYEIVSGLSSLVDARIALQIASENMRKAALEELAAEIRLWRRLLRDSDALITQMIANAVLHRKYALASDIMRVYPDTVRQYPSTMLEIAQPLSNQETNFVRVLESEFRLTTAFYLDLPRSTKNTYADHGKLDTLVNSAALMGLYKPMATINQTYSTFQKNAQFYAQTPKEIVNGHAAHMEQLNDFDPVRPSFILYNPIGKTLAAVGTHDLGMYSFRLHDLQARSRLLELQRRIAEGNIQPDRRLAFLADAGKDLMNPYTEKPFELDKSGKLISFEGYGERYLKDGRVQVELAN